jgi:hypothetical protein
MSSPHRTIAWLLVGLMSCQSAQAEVRGRRVGDVLDELRSQGLTFIYNTQILPDELRVEREPRAASGLALAREILAPHGLELSQAAPGVYAVLRTPAEVLPPPAVVQAEPEIEEVIVQTSRYRLQAAALDAPTTLTQEYVQHQPRLADETLRAVQRLPGAATNGYSSIGAVRGGEPNETAIVLDGLRLYEPFHLRNFLSPVSVLDSRIIEDVEFYSGGFAAPYGDRMSALIDTTTIAPPAARYYELGLSLFHASVLGAGRFDGERGAWLASARRSNLGELARWSENDFGEPHYADAFGKVAYAIAPDTDLAVRVLASGDSLTAVRDRGAERASARYSNVYTWATLDHRWTDVSSSRAILSYTDVHSARDGSVDDPGRRAGQVHDDREFSIVGLRLEHDMRLKDVDYRLGGELRRLWGGYEYASELSFAADYPFPGSPPSTMMRAAAPTPTGFESGVYADARFELGSQWTAQAGLRVDAQTYDGSDDGAQWNPRVSLLRALGPRTSVRASWGRYAQQQGVNELQVEDGVSRFHAAQRAEHLIAAFEHAFEAPFDLRIEAYRKRYTRLSPRYENLFDPLVLFPEAQFDRVRVDPERAQAEGVEVLARLRPRGPWSGSLGYAWSRVRDRIDARDVARSWDQRHAVNISLMWASGPWTAAIVDSFHSGWPTTPLVLIEEGGVLRLDPRVRNRERFADYNSLDLRLTRTFALSRGALDVFVEATNVASQENECCVEYRVLRAADGAVVIERDVDSWLPLVPSIGVLWRY